jgi:ABC-2 type transport system ATP-binding protein
LTDPELVLLDEPTNGLDPAGVVEMRQLIQRLSSLGKTIFISSHILYEIQHVCNRVAIVQKGKLITQADVSELLREGSLEEVFLNLTAPSASKTSPHTQQGNSSVSSMEKRG